jgi:hypothetical protein
MAAYNNEAGQIPMPEDQDVFDAKTDDAATKHAKCYTDRMAQLCFCTAELCYAAVLDVQTARNLYKADGDMSLMESRLQTVKDYATISDQINKRAIATSQTMHELYHRESTNKARMQVHGDIGWEYAQQIDVFNEEMEQALEELDRYVVNQKEEIKKIKQQEEDK